MYAEKRKWNIELDKQPKLRTYKLFKTEFKLEDYVHMDLSLSQRSVLAQIRCGVLPLRIEMRRFEGKAEAERLCKFGDTNSVESEIHFIFQCPLYADRRNTHFDEIWLLKVWILTVSCVYSWMISIASERLFVIFRTHTHWEIHPYITRMFIIKHLIFKVSITTIFI